MSTAFDALRLEAGLSTFAELLDHPAWMRDGACLEHPEVSFFPARGEDSAPAKAVCRGCLVREECLGYAIANSEHGIWGGMARRERGRRTAQRQSEEQDAAA